MKKLLVIGYVWPEPNSSAAGSRMMDILHFFLQQQWQIIFSSPAAPSIHQADLSKLGISQQNIALNCDSFNQFIAELQPTIVLFDRFMMEEQFGWRVEKNAPEALRILESSDLHFLRNARQQAHKEGQSLSNIELHTELAMREVAAIYRCDLTLVISEYEMQLLQQQFSIDKQLLHYLPFMTDLIQSTQDNLTFSERSHFISIGNFRHPPNWDSVLWLKEKIWPRIHQAIPEAELHIYGAYPPKKATALHNPKKGLHILGWAEDAITVLKKSRVVLCPLRFGAGLKGKLFDAMLAGTPSITTSIGAEGMHGNLPWCGTITESEKEIAEAASQLYHNQQQWQEAQDNGFTILEKRFNKQQHSNELYQRITHIENNREDQRNKNFIGMMLRHHHHRSTEYMSRWITEKNRDTQNPTKE